MPRSILVCAALIVSALAISPLITGQGDLGKDIPADHPQSLDSQKAKELMLELIGFHDANKNTQLVTTKQMLGITAFLYLGLHEGWTHDVDKRSMDMRPTGPFIDKVGYNTHQRVRVYYSDEVVTWLNNDRQGDIKDGAMIVKQMYTSDPNDSSYGGEKVTGWAVMIRDGKATADGWLWYLFFFPGTPSYGDVVLLSQYGMSFCLACHAGTDTDQNTFSYSGNLDGKNATQYTVINTPAPMKKPGTTLDTQEEGKPAVAAGHSGLNSMLGLDPETLKSIMGSLAKHRGTKDIERLKDIVIAFDTLLSIERKPSAESGVIDKVFQGMMSKPVTKPLEKPNAAIVTTFGERKSVELPRPLPWDLFTGHTTVSPTDPKLFVTSDNCRGCHDASLLLGGRQPEMMVYQHSGKDDPKLDKINLSPYGEWGASMMGLAGRDPIFLAQLESEQTLRPKIADWTANLCLSCHQVAGQRQFHLDGQDGNFTADYTYVQPAGETLNEKTEYGALGRDGVTCTVCHQITPEGLGESTTFTGNFNVNKEPGTMWGPFPTEEIKPYYMQQALNMEPKHGQQITDPGLCGSCHTIVLPVLPADPKAPPTKNTKTVHEQTTYLEWLNSEYKDDPAKTCQGCHMPNNFREMEKLEFTIANVEDGDFPQVNNRAAAELITPEPKKGYRRHTLVGLSVFANRMFQQFPELLGYTTLDPGTELTYGPSAKGAMHRLTLTEQEMLLMAAATADLKASIDKREKNWVVNVTLHNKAGHKFPSGVGFRRAFLEVTALAADGSVLWGSGQTNAAGVIVDGSGHPLPAEFTLNWKELQPDYPTITNEDQVQIFETRHINIDGELTTSFLGLDEEVKDNRLLPSGWSPKGLYAAETQLRKLGGKVFNPRVPGTRKITYEIPTFDDQIDSVQVRLMYQSTPPYYLRDRFLTEGKENDRLHYLVSRLNLKGTLAENWSLEVARTLAR
jgi:hypothetical protein